MTWAPTNATDLLAPMARPAAALAASAASTASTSPKPWRIIPRPLLETILNNFAHHLRVPQPLLIHGPRGVGKTSLLLHRLLPQWNKGPHIAAFVDFSPTTNSIPWTTPSPPAATDLLPLTARLDRELESMAERGVRLGTIGSRSIFCALTKWHGVGAALHRIIGPGRLSKRDETAPASALWNKALIAFRSRIGDTAIYAALGEAALEKQEVEFMKEGVVALRLAKEVIRMHQEWRREAVRHLNRTGDFSRTLANSATDWPCLLLQILSDAAEIDFFQPKLVINNIDILRRMTITDDSTVPAAMYHDSLIWRVVELGVNERCLPIFFITSDSYYSYQAFMDFGFRDIFIYRETFGWTLQQAKLHMVSDFFSESEWKVIDEVLGPNLRHLSELYALKKADLYQADGQSNFEDVVDAYLAFLQVTEVNPAMESALDMLQKFASDVRNGKIPKEQLHFGAPWRHPPRSDDPIASLKWAKIQLMDFVQSLVNTEFAVNYLADKTFEILDDPSLTAMLEVGLLYQQRDPSFVRPISLGIQRCLVRWLVQERMQLSLQDYLSFLWQRIIRGRSYRHLMKEIGYK